MNIVRTLNILVADDDPLISRVLLNALEREGHSVTITDDGAAAIAQMLQQSLGQDFDLLICDINMPGKSGITTISEAKKLQHTLKILAITAGGTMRGNDVMALTQNSSADAILTKPFSPDQLLEKISSSPSWE